MCEVNVERRPHRPSVARSESPRSEWYRRVNCLRSETRQTVTGTHARNVPVTQHVDRPEITPP